MTELSKPHLQVGIFVFQNFPLQKTLFRRVCNSGGFMSKTKMQSFSLRLDTEAALEIETLARLRYIPARTMARQWLMQRLQEEKKEANIRE